MVSIVVPVYNVEKYLVRCIESILSQTYTDIELVLVDDGSVDKSAEICDRYGFLDSRVKVYHKKNGGVSSARNYGIEKSNGNYIAFIDSDDWIERNYVESFDFENIYADLYISGALYDVNDAVYSFKKYEKTYADNLQDVVKTFFSQNLKDNGYPWGKLFSRKLIIENNIRFNEELTINEDHVFVFDYLSSIRSINVTNYAGYHYTVIDTTGRKLSSKTNSCAELIKANRLFLRCIDKLHNNWSLQELEYSELKNYYKYEHRKTVLRSSIILGDYQSYKEECIFWEKSQYTQADKKFSILLLLIQSIPITSLSFYLLRLFIVFIKMRKSTSLTDEIINDLAQRSTIIK